MSFQELNNMLCEAANITKDKIQNVELTVNGLSFLKLRDAIIRIGRIHSEDIERQIYIASVGGGFLKKNTAVVVLHLNSKSLQISLYAKEGIINQHTCEDVIDEIKGSLQMYIEE